MVTPIASFHQYESGNAKHIRFSLVGILHTLKRGMNLLDNTIRLNPPSEISPRVCQSDSGSQAGSMSTPGRGPTGNKKGLRGQANGVHLEADRSRRWRR
ncbi:hypothetical protein CGCTS75_v002061 [Colletotrichum tropicale]|nr:hypothetical protein CGCTS75_v002061 [Colletotrichum tropicale]